MCSPFLISRVFYKCGLLGAAFVTRRGSPETVQAIVPVDSWFLSLLAVFQVHGALRRHRPGPSGVAPAWGCCEYPPLLTLP